MKKYSIFLNVYQYDSSKLYFKICYCLFSSLSFVSLDTAEEVDTGKLRAIEVEKCNCPRGYQGLSCEDCAVGYTRGIEGLYLGICEPCKCNGHSHQCDPETGICTVRENNFFRKYWEYGYWGINNFY